MSGLIPTDFNVTIKFDKEDLAVLAMVILIIMFCGFILQRVVKKA